MRSERASLWVAVHGHKHGSDAYLFWFDGEAMDEEAEERVVKQLDINYEPDLAESLNCHQVNIGREIHVDNLPVVT